MSDPVIFTAPDFQQVSIDTLINNSPALADLREQLTALAASVTTMQGQITDLTTRVEALEAKVP
jgi:chaperonin cofactor prefoldin